MKFRLEKYIFICIFIMLGLNIYASYQPNLKLDTTGISKIESNLDFTKNKVVIKTAIDENGKLFYLDKVYKDSLLIVDASTNSKIKLYGNRKNINYASIKDMSVRNNKIFILVSNSPNTNLIIHDFKTNKTIDDLKFDNVFDQIQLFDRYFFVSRNYNYSEQDTKIKTLIEKYSYDYEELQNIPLELTSIELTAFQPNQYIDYSLDFISVVNPDLMAIRLYNHDFILQDSLYLAPSTFPEKNIYWEDSLKTIRNKKGAIAGIEYMSNMLEQGFGRIVNLSFKNDTTIIIYYLSNSEHDNDNYINHVQEIHIENAKLIEADNYKEEFTDNYIPLFAAEHNLNFFDNKVYFFSMYDYNQISSFGGIASLKNHTMKNMTTPKPTAKLYRFVYE